MRDRRTSRREAAMAIAERLEALTHNLELLSLESGKAQYQAETRRSSLLAGAGNNRESMN
jgi:hypothetical protein